MGRVVVSNPKAIVTQRDVTRIVKGAAAAGITMGIVVTNGEVRFIPVDMIVAAEKPSDLDSWKARRDARKAKAQARGDS